MKRKLSYLLLLMLSALTLHTANAQATRSFGLILDDTLYDNSPRLAVGSKSSVSEPQFSLKAYTPVPGNQGECNSCVCWAACYGALTTSWAYKNQITDKQQISDNARSPMYVFIQIAKACENGSRLSDAMRVLKAQGACQHSEFNPKTYLVGENHMPEIEPFKNTALANRIKDFATLFPVNADSAKKVDETKLSIVNHQPVVAGFNLYTSFMDLNERNSFWKPDLSTEKLLGSHAMCVIGYNDYSKTFEVMNSWGVTWGNLGYFTISYKDYVRLAKYAYQLTLDDRKAADSEVTVNGDFSLEKFTTWDNVADKPVFNDVKPTLVNNEYTLSGNGFNNGDYYRLFAKNVRANCYIYVFSIDPNNKAEILYPFSLNAQYSVDHNLTATVAEVPRLYGNAIIEIPGNNKVIKTDVPGMDSMCILYSYNQIDDIKTVVSNIKASTKPAMMDKLKDVLGNRLMANTELQYQPDKMSVTGASKSGDIIPIILKVNVN